MSYTAKIVALATVILEEAQRAVALEKDLADWKFPKGRTHHVGGATHYVVREDGSVTPGFEGIQREAVALLERQIIKAHGRIEGLRFQLVKLGKTGGAR